MILPLPSPPPAVAPILVGPLQALFQLLPFILLGLAGLFGSIIMTITRPKKLIRFIWVQKIALVIVAAVGVGLWFLFAHVLPSNATGPVAGGEEGKDWPAWRGGLDRRGWVPGSEDPARGGVNWQFVDGSYKSFYSSPAVVGNRVYVASALLSAFDVNGSGYIYSLDADTGKIVWKYAPKKYRATFSSPAVGDGFLAIGEGLHNTLDARIVCLDVKASEKQRQGVELWEYRAHWHVESSPAIGEGKVVVGAASDGVYCFDAKGDGKGGAKLLWHLDGDRSATPGPYTDVESSPLIYKGRVYFGLGRFGGQAIACVNAASGDLIWRLNTPYAVSGSPAIADNRLYVGMGVGDFVNTAAALQAEEKAKLQKEGKSDAEIAEALKALVPAGEVWCVDLSVDKPAKPLWTFHTGETVLGAVAVDGKKLYFGSVDNYLYCLTTGGKLVNKWNARAAVQASVAVGKDHVYVGTPTGRLYGLDKETLQPDWEVALNSPIMSSPAVARGHVYVGTYQAIGNEPGGFICAGEPALANAKTVWAGDLGGPGQCGWVRGSLLSDRGKFFWQFPPESSEGNGAAGGAVYAPPAFIGNLCYIGVNAKDKKGLRRLTLDPQKPAAAPAKEDWLAASDNPVYLSAAATDDRVFFVDGQKGDANRKLRCLDPQTGAPLWSLPVETAASGQFFLTGRYLLIADKAGALSCWALPDDAAKPADLLWTRPVGAVVDTPVLDGNLLVAATEGDQPQLLVLDLATGMELWRRPLDSPPRHAPVLVAHQLWLGGADGMTRFDLIDGQRLRTINCQGVSGALVTDGAKLACINNKGQAVVFDPAGGSLVYVPGAAVGAVPVLNGDNLVFPGPKSIQLCRLPQSDAAAATQPAPPAVVLPAARLWCQTDFMGKMTAPLVVRNAQIYFATEGMGFVCAGTRD